MNDHRIARRVWKIRISMHVNSISSKDTGETRTIYVWSDNEKIMWGSDTDIIRDTNIRYYQRTFFKSFLHNYPEEMKIIKGSDFNFESVDLMDYKLRRVRLRKGTLYIESLEWLLYKRATINPKNKKR